MDDLQTSEELQLVSFRLGTEEYGLPITKVQEINRLEKITKLPQAPAFMEGVTNLRGKVIPIIDLRKRFQLVAKAYDDDSRVIVVDVSGQTVGIIVDTVAEVVQIPRASIEPPPQSFILDAKYIHGVGKINERLLILLDIDKILTTQDEIILKQMDQDGQ